MALHLVTSAGSLALGVALGFHPLATVPTRAPGAGPAGAWRWPLPGTPVVARPFEPPAHPWSAGHRGVDLAAAPGATVLAAGSGVVSFAGYVAGVGVVSIRHVGGLRTTYEPVLPHVRAGAAVTAGQPIGRLRAGHGSCGPGRWCLHWGLLRGPVYLNPLTLIHRGPVRLLPLSGEPARVGQQPGTLVAAPAMVAPPTLRVVSPPGPDRAVAEPQSSRWIGPTGTAAAGGAGLLAAAAWWRRRTNGTWRPQRWRLGWAAGTPAAKGG